MNPQALVLLLLSTFTSFTVASIFRDVKSPLKRKFDDLYPSTRVFESGNTEAESISSIESTSATLDDSVELPEVDFVDNSVKVTRPFLTQSRSRLAVYELPFLNYDKLIKALGQDGEIESLYLRNVLETRPELLQYNTKQGKTLLTLATQNQIDFLAQNYNGNVLLMDKLIEACCLNPNLRLPNTFFEDSNPERVLRRIIVATNSKGQGRERVRRQAYTLPGSLDLYYPHGETVLNKAIHSGDIFAFNLIMNRPDCRELAKKISLNGASTIEIVANSFYRREIVPILFSALDEIASTTEMEPMRQVSSLIQDYFRNAVQCGALDIVKMLQDKIVLLLSKVEVNMILNEHSQEYKEAALALVYAYEQIDNILRTTKTEYFDLLKRVKSSLCMLHH